MIILPPAVAWADAKGPWNQLMPVVRVPQPHIMAERANIESARIMLGYPICGKFNRGYSATKQPKIVSGIILRSLSGNFPACKQL